MNKSSELEELAAVVADGLAFDWIEAQRNGATTALQPLWRAVHDRGRRDLPQIRPARADLHWILWSVVIIAALKSVLAVIGLSQLQSPFRTLPIQGLLLAVFAVTGALLLYGGARDRRARHFGALLLTVGNVFANPLILELANRLDGPWQRVLLVLRSMPVEAFAPALFWLFVRAFPAAPTSPRLHRFFHRTLTLCAAIGSGLFVANVAGGVLGGAPPWWARLLDRNSSGTSYFWLVIFMISVPALFVIVGQSRRAGQTERAKVRMFVLGIVSGFVPGLLVLLLANRSSPLRPFLLQNFWLVGALLYSGLLLVPLITSYAVLVDRVIRVELVVRNSLRFLLARASLAVLTIAPALGLALHVYQHRSGTVREVAADATFVVLAAMTLLMLLLTRVRERMLLAVDRRLFREGRPLEMVLSQLGAGLTQATGLHDLARSVCNALEWTLHPERSFVLVRDPARSQLVPVGSATRPLALDTWLVGALERSREPVLVDLEEESGVGRLLPADDQEWLADSSAVALAPLVATNESLIGLIGVGAKKSTLAFTSRDIAVLTATAAAVAPAFEARLLRAVGAAVDAPLPVLDWRDEPGLECQRCGQIIDDSAATHCPCGGTVTSMVVPVVLNGKFQLQQRLGAGGMGVVYRARDLSLHRAVAIKTLPRIMPAAAQRLRLEAQAMAAVSHPALAVIYGAETWKSVPLLIVEFLEGGTLSDRLRRGPIPELQAVELGVVLAEALGRLHAAGMLHRDVKPSNVAFTGDSRPKLLDFGLARLIERDVADVYEANDYGVYSAGRPATTALTSQLAGTPLYLSPEAVRGQAPAPSFDLWALAVLLLEAVAGQHPWARLSTDDVLARIARDGTPKIEHLDLHCSDALRQFFIAALSVDVNQRWQNAVDFAEALGDTR